MWIDTTIKPGNLNSLALSYIHSYLDCGMKGQGWHGPPGNQDLPNQPFQNVASSCDCNHQCIGESDCEYWVYEEANGNCWLKKNFEKIIETPGEISGLKGFEFQQFILIQ